MAEPAGLWQRLELQLHLESETGGLWPRLEERLSTVQSHPRLREGLVLNPAPQGERQSFLLSDPLGGRHFHLGEREAYILSLLDGEREVVDVIGACSERFGPIAAQTVERFLRDLQLAGLLEEGSKLWGYLGLARRDRSVFWTLPQAAGKLAALYQRLSLLFRPWIWGLVLGLLAASLVTIVYQRDLFQADLSYLSSPWRLLPFLLVTFYPIMLLVALTHELAHALACTHFGGRVSRFGLMIRHLLPAAFADVSAVASLPRGERIAVFLAGPASTVFWVALSTAVWVWAPPDSFFHLVGAAVLLASLLSIWVGLNPVAGYDGTEILSEWLHVPSLHPRALQFCWGKARGRTTEATSAAPRERRVFWVYSSCFFLYNVAVVALILTIVLRLLLSRG